MLIVFSALLLVVLSLWTVTLASLAHASHHSLETGAALVMSWVLLGMVCTVTAEPLVFLPPFISGPEGGSAEAPFTASFQR